MAELNLQSHSIIANSELMCSILEQVQTIANSDSSVLLIGETGVGKEMIAEYVHRSSQRSRKPLVKVGLSTLSPELMENELFGHERGAYTGATEARKGPFELAHAGSIFLDDIDDFPLSLQTKLLRVLESRELKRVGGGSSIPIDVRLITATKVDLKALVERGLFRSDLYYRINVVPIVIPPLRDRQDDIPALVEHYLHRYSPDAEIAIEDATMQTLVDYPWPGNVRELKNIVQRIALFPGEKIQPCDLPGEIRDDNPIQLIVKACGQCFTDKNISLNEVMNCLEVNLIRHALTQSGGSRTKAAELLGLNRTTLHDKLMKHNLNDPDS